MHVKQINTDLMITQISLMLMKFLILELEVTRWVNGLVDCKVCLQTKLVILFSRIMTMSLLKMKF